MSVLVKANIDSKIATHAALTTGIHGVGALNIAGFHSAGEALSKIIWKDVSETAVSDLNRTTNLSSTVLDLTALTSEKAKGVFLLLEIRADTVGSGNSSYLQLWKNDTSPVHRPTVNLDKAGTTVAVYQYEEVFVGLDSDRKLEYIIQVGTGWQVDSRIRVLGYIE